MENINNIRFILIETSHPGNIGAVARAMKTMGLTQLSLVRPSGFPSAECTARACGADDLLAKAQVYTNLLDAIADCQLIIGSSVRQRTIAWQELTPSQTAIQLLNTANYAPVALLLGRECSGLSNTELDLCHAVAKIPSNPQFSSLNIAAAAQIFAYEIRMTILAQQQLNTTNSIPREVAPLAELESMFEHLAQTIVEIDFADPQKTRRLMRRLRRLLLRAQPDRNEINIVRGLLSSAQHLARRLRLV